MTRTCDWSTIQIAAAIQRDAALTADVLRLANSHLYNPTGKRIAHVDEAIMRIGQKRVGELALAASSLARLAPEALPWLDLDIIWRRSMAAGLVMESLIEQGGHQAIEEGLLLSALMYPLGRVALGMLFPNEYSEMVQTCEQSGQALQEQERRALPTSHVQVLSHLLAGWNIGNNIHLPLKFALDEYSALLRLDEPLRTKCELVKVAIALGRLAVNRWHDWDLVNLPSPGLLKRLRISNAREIVDRAKADVAKLAGFSLVEPRAEQEVKDSWPLRRINFCNLDDHPNDLLPALLGCFGFEPQSCTVEELAAKTSATVINGLGAPFKKLAGLAGEGMRTIITTREKSDQIGRRATTIGLPISYGDLKQRLGAVAEDAQSIHMAKPSSWIERISQLPGRAKKPAVVGGPSSLRT